MQKSMIVEVACLVDFDELDNEDRAFDGTCAVDGSYMITLTDIPDDATDVKIIDRTLDSFHGTVPIASLEDFSISTRAANAHDTQGGMRAFWDASYMDLEKQAAGMSGTEVSGGGLPEPSPYSGSSTDDPFSET